MPNIFAWMFTSERLFSAETLALLLATALLMQASQPLLLAGGRIAEASSRLFGWWMKPEQRNINRTGDLSHRSAHVQGPIQSLAFQTGLLIFLSVLHGLWSGTTQGFGALSAVLAGKESLLDVMLAWTILFAALANSLLATALGAWRSRLLGSACMVLQWIIRIGIISIAMATEFNMAVLLQLAIICTILRSAIAMVSVGIRAYGLLAIAWMPFALLAWAADVIAAAVAGPLALMLIPLSDRSVTSVPEDDPDETESMLFARDAVSLTRSPI